MIETGWFGQNPHVVSKSHLRDHTAAQLLAQPPPARSTHVIHRSTITLIAFCTSLLARLPAAIGARFDRACGQSQLPEAVIAALVGVGAEELWNIRNRGVIPPGALPRVRAFVEAGR